MPTSTSARSAASATPGSCCRPSPSWPIRPRSRPAIAARLAEVDPDAAHPLNLFRSHWFNGPGPTGTGRGPGPRRPAPGADRGRLPDRRRPRRPLPDDRLAQGHRRVRLPGPAARDRPVRPDQPAGRLAVDRQLLPGRRGHLADHGLPRRGRPAGRDEPRAVRVARALGDRSRGHHPDARHREQRQGDLRPLRGARPRARHRDLQPVLGVREPPRPLRHHRAGDRDRRRVDAGDRPGPAPAGVRVGDRLGRDDRGRRLPQGASRVADGRGRGARVPDDAPQRLRRAQHPGHRRQAHPAHPRRDGDGHRRGRLRPGDRPPRGHVRLAGGSGLPRSSGVTCPRRSSGPSPRWASRACATSSPRSRSRSTRATARTTSSRRSRPMAPRCT